LFSKLSSPNPERHNKAWPVFSLKRALYNLNIDLDNIRSQIRSYDSFYYTRKHTTLNADFSYDYAELSTIERAVLTLEDRRFFKHSGFDIWCIPRGAKRFFRYWKLGGISTIDQQLVRTITGKRERTIRRKFRELILAYSLNCHESKRKILSSYLKICYLGHGIWGVDSGSALLFGKSANSLSDTEAAFIASLLARPMPKEVITISKKNNLFPVRDVFYFYDILSGNSIEWARHSMARMQYCIALMQNSKQPLYKI